MNECAVWPAWRTWLQEVERQVARLAGVLDSDISRGLEPLPIPLVNEVDDERVRPLCPPSALPPTYSGHHGMQRDCCECTRCPAQPRYPQAEGASPSLPANFVFHSQTAITSTAMGGPMQVCRLGELAVIVIAGLAEVPTVPV